MRALLMAALFIFSTPAFAGPNDPWTIDPAKSRIEFNAAQIGKIVSGRIKSWTGTIVLDPANPAAARIEIRMDMRSASAGTTDVDQLMLGKDFLDVAKTPEARFTSTGVISKGGDRYEARGKLTLRDTTKDVVLPFTLTIRDTQASARGRIEIKRLDYGVGRSEWASTNVVADEVTIDITVAAARP
ncbi:MAG: YceI family protein, partial [Alphaproteobacteria bacterium]|nr:YceI family protein [Alphaproteobacteria bacterium]